MTHYVALGDSITIDDYAGGPGHGGASLLLGNRDDDFPEWIGRDLVSGSATPRSSVPSVSSSERAAWLCNVIEPDAWGASGVRAAFWQALRD